MSKKYDISLKETISGLEGAFTELFLGFEIKEASEPLNIELQKIEEKQADFVSKIVDLNNKEYILHIEFQVSNHKDMYFRMLRYLTELHKRYNLPIIQLVIYLGKDKMSMEDSINFSCYDTKIDYRYKLVNISTLNCEDFINSDKSELVLIGILCDFKNKNKREVVRKIREKLELFCEGDYNKLRNQFLKLEVFSKLRNLTDIVKEEEKMLADRIRVEDLPSYSIGMDRGINQGARDKQIEIAKNLLKAKVNLNTIALSTGLSIEEIKKLMNLL